MKVIIGDGYRAMKRKVAYEDAHTNIIIYVCASSYVTFSLHCIFNYTMSLEQKQWSIKSEMVNVLMSFIIILAIISNF